MPKHTTLSKGETPVNSEHISHLATSISADARPAIQPSVAVSLNAHCFNPSFSFNFVGEGLYPGKKSYGTTGFIQANIKTASPGPGVLFVNGRNSGVVDITLPAGTKAVGGEVYIDKINAYTRHEDDNNSQTFPPDEIVKHITVTAEPVANTIRFLIKVNPCVLKGTINARLTVVYETAT